MAAVTRLTLLCHGATRATRATTFPAPGDPLAPRALRALPDLGGRLEAGPRNWTSPAVGAVATAAALDLPVGTDARLGDCDYGRWTGRTISEIERAEAGGLAAWFTDPEARPHGGESLAAVASRVGDWLAHCAGQGGRVLAVSHPLVIRLAVVAAVEAPLAVQWRLDVAPLSLTRLTAENGRWRLAGLNLR